MRMNACRGSLVLAILMCATSVVAGETKRLTGFQDRLIPTEHGQLCCAHRPGDGPTLLLIPGTFSDSRAFAKLAPHLGKDLNLFVLENRGLGRSWPPPQDGSIEQCAQDALLVAEKLGLESFYIGGHSLGGMISLEVGRRAPDKLRGVISLEGWTSWHAARDAFHGDMKATLTDEQLAELAAYRKEVLAQWSDEQRSSFGKVWKAWDGLSFLERTSLPVLEIYGDRGRARPTRENLRIPERDNIQLKWVDNSSHSLHYQHPRRVAEAINRFIRQQEAKRAGK
ncbi:alpha/beta hydrolase [Symmachiella dynata]|uniref:alpha/beta fold hydrolase n=1 Tax=Symmachiella dynata TaxID=2527995 RepID=UPI0030EBD7D6